MLTVLSFQYYFLQCYDIMMKRKALCLILSNAWLNQLSKKIKTSLFITLILWKGDVFGSDETRFSANGWIDYKVQWLKLFIKTPRVLWAQYTEKIFYKTHLNNFFRTSGLFFKYDGLNYLLKSRKCHDTIELKKIFYKLKR